jgi:hypothetical protein
MIASAFLGRYPRGAKQIQSSRENTKEQKAPSEEKGPGEQFIIAPGAYGSGPCHFLKSAKNGA